jgi:hypothetical protein
LNDGEVVPEATASVEPASGDFVSDDTNSNSSGEHANGDNGEMFSRVATNSPSIEEGRATRRSGSLVFGSEPSAQAELDWGHSGCSSPESSATSPDANLAHAHFLHSHVSLSIRDSFPAGFEPSEIFNKDLASQICGIEKLLDSHCHELDAVVCKKRSAFNKWQENEKLLRQRENELSKMKVELEKSRSNCALPPYNGLNKFDEDFAHLRRLLGQEEVKDLEKQIVERQGELQHLRDSAAESDAELQRSISAHAKVLAPYQNPTFERQSLDRILISILKVLQHLQDYKKQHDISRQTVDTDVTG